MSSFLVRSILREFSAIVLLVSMGVLVLVALDRGETVAAWGFGIVMIFAALMWAANRVD